MLFGSFLKKIGINIPRLKSFKLKIDYVHNLKNEDIQRLIECIERSFTNLQSLSLYIQLYDPTETDVTSEGILNIAYQISSGFSKLKEFYFKVSREQMELELSKEVRDKIQSVLRGVPNLKYEIN